MGLNIEIKDMLTADSKQIYAEWIIWDGKRIVAKGRSDTHKEALADARSKVSALGIPKVGDLW